VQVLDRVAQADTRGGAQVLEGGAQAFALCIAGTVARSAARCALQILDRFAQAAARGDARCASQCCVYLTCCPCRCPQRR